MYFGLNYQKLVLLQLKREFKVRHKSCKKTQMLMLPAFLFPLHVHSSLSKPAWLAHFLYINGNTSPPALLLLDVDLHSKVI